MGKNKVVIAYVIGILALVGLIALLANLNGSSNNNSNGESTSLNLNLKDNEWTKGGANASVTLVEYSDFQCPACGSYYPLVKDLIANFGPKIKVIYRHFPLSSIHPNAEAAARAAEAAGLQGKFWEMHDMLFEKQYEWSTLTRVDDTLIAYAESLGLDKEKFMENYESKAVKDAVDEDTKSALEIGLNSTPSFILNGQKIQNPSSLEQFVELVQTAMDNAPAPEVSEVSLVDAEDVKEYANFAIYVNDKKIDLSQDKYQSNDPYVSLESNGNVISKKKAGVTVGYLLETLGGSLDEKCLSLDTDEKYCNDENNSLKFFVNGSRSLTYQNYEISDLDKILINYGPLTDSNLKSQIDSVSNEACIYSESCSEVE